MKSRTCPTEPDVLSAFGTGDRLGAAWNHLRACARCQDALAVSGWLDASPDVDEGHPLPDPGRIYWRAQLQHRRAMARRATQAIWLLEQVTVAAGTAAVLLLAWLAWPAISGAVGDVIDLGSMTASSSVMNLTVATALLVVTVALAWCTASFDEA